MRLVASDRQAHWLTRYYFLFPLFFNFVFPIYSTNVMWYCRDYIINTKHCKSVKSFEKEDYSFGGTIDRPRFKHLTLQVENRDVKGNKVKHSTWALENVGKSINGLKTENGEKTEILIKSINEIATIKRRWGISSPHICEFHHSEPLSQ